MKRVAAVEMALTILAALAAGAPLSANPRGHVLGLAVAPLYTVARDDVLAPLRWGGFGGALDFSYGYTGRRGRHIVELGLMAAGLSNRYRADAAVAASHLGYTFFREPPQPTRYGAIEPGLFLEWSTNVQFYYSWDEEHIYWLTAYEVGPAVCVSNDLSSRHVLRTSAWIPVLALISRPPEHRYYKTGRLKHLGYYFSKTHEDLKMKTIPVYFACRVRQDYDYGAGRRIGLGASFIIDYKTARGPERIRILTSRLMLRLRIRLGALKGR